MRGLGKDPVSAPEEARAIIQEWIGAKEAIRRRRKTHG
jgi:hypothetical protein